MNILILGGCGFIGSSVARDLIKSPDVGRVRLADIRPDLERVSESVRLSQKVSVEPIDVTGDFDTLVGAIRSSDLVINSAGPFPELGTGALRAAIEARVNYMDVCDDGATTRQFLELDAAARQAGICASTGWGCTPGVANLVAMRAASRMSRTDEVSIFFVISLVDPVGRGGLLGAMRQFAGKVWQFDCGREKMVDGGAGPERTEFLPPFGAAEVRYARHPEPVTLPRYIPGLKKVVSKAVFWPPSVAKLFLTFIKAGFYESGPVTVNGADVVPRDFLLAYLLSRPDLRSAPGLDASMACNVVVKGIEAGAPVTRTFRMVGWGGPIVAIPTATFALMLARGQAKGATGVVPPEASVDADRFLAEIARRGIEVIEQPPAT